MHNIITLFFSFKKKKISKNMEAWDIAALESEDMNEVENNLSSIFETNDFEDCIESGLDLPSIVEICERSASLDQIKYSNDDAFYPEAHQDDSRG